MNTYRDFTDYCKRENIDVDNTFAFAGSRKTKGDRIECKSGFTSRKLQQSFVIYYEKTLKLYFAWSLGVATAPTKTFFLAKISDMSDPNEFGIRTIVKTISNSRSTYRNCYGF